MAGLAAKAIAWVGKKILGKDGKDSIVGTVVDRLVPDKAEAAKIKAEMEKELQAHENELEADFMEAVREAQTIHEWEPKLSQILKGSTRWIIALIMTGFYIYLRVTSSGITEFDQYLIGGIWGFLFLLRSVEKVTKRDK